jgi:hypothetical protein
VTDAKSEAIIFYKKKRLVLLDSEGNQSSEHHLMFLDLVGLAWLFVILIACRVILVFLCLNYWHLLRVFYGFLFSIVTWVIFDNKKALCLNLST